MSEDQQTYETPEMTQEQMAEKRKQLDAFYEDVIPHLEKQLKYEELRAAIEMARLKNLQAQVAMANMMAPEPDEDEDDEPTEQPLRRTLRRDK
jgi:hypothetical protein